MDEFSVSQCWSILHCHTVVNPQSVQPRTGAFLGVRVVFPPSPENAFEEGCKVFGQAMARNVCDNKEKCLCHFKCRSPLSSGGKMDLKRSTISTTTMIGWRLIHSSMFRQEREVIHSVVCWCSILLQRFLTVGIYPATLGISSLQGNSLFGEVARIHPRAIREKRFSPSMIGELARRLGYWSFFVACNVWVLQRCSVPGRLRYLPKA